MTQSQPNLLRQLPASEPSESVTVDPVVSLASRAAAGQVEATHRLLELVSGSVQRAAAAVLGVQSPDVDDVVQQSLIAFVQALPGFRGECHPRSYACTIAVRTAMAVRRKRARYEERLGTLAKDVPRDEGSVQTPHELSAAARRCALLRELLEDLPEPQAEALALRTMLGYSLKEVAAVTNAPVNTVRSRLRLAKEALRRRIEADPELLAELGVQS